MQYFSYSKRDTINMYIAADSLLSATDPTDHPLRLPFPINHHRPATIFPFATLSSAFRAHRSTASTALSACRCMPMYRSQSGSFPLNYHYVIGNTSLFTIALFLEHCFFDDFTNLYARQFLSHSLAHLFFPFKFILLFSLIFISFHFIYAPLPHSSAQHHHHAFHIRRFHRFLQSFTKMYFNFIVWHRTYRHHHRHNHHRCRRCYCCCCWRLLFFTIHFNANSMSWLRSIIHNDICGIH